MNDDSWFISQIDFGIVRRLATELDVSQVTAEVLARRGFTDVEAARGFLHPDHRLHSPYLLSGMAEARARIDCALQQGESIAVHGDYDADGITATFVTVEVLQSLGAHVSWRLPNRFTEGYGIVAATIEELAAAGVRLLVTVDCGINSVAEVRLAQKLGMDVIVTDHHELAGELPPCIVVSPKLAGYPFSGLAGVGVACKLAHALLQDRGEDRVELPLNLPIVRHAFDKPRVQYRDSCRALAKKYTIPKINFLKRTHLVSSDFADLFHLVEPGRVKWQLRLSKTVVSLLARYGMESP